MSLYLPDGMLRSVIGRAKTENVSAVEIVRRAIEEYVRKGRRQRTREGYEQLWDIVGIARGPGDVARRHDEYLTGRPESKKVASGRPGRPA